MGQGRGSQGRAGDHGSWGCRGTPGAGSRGAGGSLRPSPGRRTEAAACGVTPGCVPGGWDGGIAPGPPATRGVGVPRAPLAGLRGCRPRGTPRVPGTKRLWQPHGVDAAVFPGARHRWRGPRSHPGTASRLPWYGVTLLWRGDPCCAGPPAAPRCRGQECQHPARARQAPAVPARAGSDGRAEPWQLGWSWRRPSPFPGPLGSWKTPGNGEPPSLIWLRRAGRPPAPLGRLPNPAPLAFPPSPLLACRARALGKRRGPCLTPRLPRRNVRWGRRSLGGGEKIPPPSRRHRWLGTTSAPASVSPSWGVLGTCRAGASQQPPGVLACAAGSTRGPHPARYPRGLFRPPWWGWGVPGGSGSPQLGGVGGSSPSRRG